MSLKTLGVLLMLAKRIGASAMLVVVWIGSYTAGHFVQDAGEQDALARRQGHQLEQQAREIDRYKETIRVLRTATITNTVTAGPVQIVYAASAPPTTTTTRPSPPVPPLPPGSPAPSPPEPVSGFVCRLLGMSCPV